MDTPPPGIVPRTGRAPNGGWENLPHSKKGASGRRSDHFARMCRAQLRHPKFLRALRKVLRDPESKHWLGASRMMTEYGQYSKAPEEVKVTGGLADLIAEAEARAAEGRNILATLRPKTGKRLKSPAPPSKASQKGKSGHRRAIRGSGTE